MAKTKKKTGVWGIDVGQCALKAIRLELNDDGQVVATAFDYVEHPKILSQPDADPDQLTREALEKFLSRNALKGDVIALGVPGQSGLARFVKLPPVEEKKINDIVRFEAKQQIPFPLEEVIWDYQKIGSGAVTDGFAMETEIGLFAMKRDMIFRSLQHFKEVNVEVQIVQMAPLALCNFVTYDLLKKGVVRPEPEEGEEKAEGEGAGEPGEEEKPSRPDDGRRHCVVALDIGTDNSNLVITDGERIIWQRPIPHGGNHFTRALTKELKLTFAKAEHVKRNATKSPDLKRILAALKPVLNDFVGEVQRSLGYFTNTHRDAQVDYVVGLGNAFRLPGLQKFLSEKLQVEVRKLGRMEELGGAEVVAAPVFTQNVMSFGVAYGLALQGLQKTRLHTNLLPQDIRFERMIRAKKPWAAAAAAVLLLGTGALGLGYSIQYGVFDNGRLNQAKKEGRDFIALVNDKRSKVQAKDAEVHRNEDAVRSIVAGNDERVDWLLLNQFIDGCVPVPAVRLEGTFQGPAKDKSDEYVLRDRAGRERSFPGDPKNTIVLVKDPSGQKEQVFAAGVAGLKRGSDVAVVYQPDPNSLPYWNKNSKEAFLKMWDRAFAQGLPPEASPEDEGVEYLIEANVEAVTARYSPDLKAAFNELRNRTKSLKFEEMGLPKKDMDNLPEKAGWIVELRGYTYHYDNQLFLKNTLLKNLQTRAVVPQGVPPAADPKDQKAAAAAGPGAPSAAPGPGTPSIASAPVAQGGTAKTTNLSPKDQAALAAQKEKDKKEAPQSPKDSKPGSPAAAPGTAPAAAATAPPEKKDPILGQISHALLYDFDSQFNVDVSEPYKLIGQSAIASLGVSGGGFKSLLSEALTGPGMSSKDVERVKRRQASRSRRTDGAKPKTLGEGIGSRAAQLGQSTPVVGVNQAKPEEIMKGPRRTEFIIFFVWKELTPSDDRMPKPAAPAKRK